MNRRNVLELVASTGALSLGAMAAAAQSTASGASETGEMPGMSGMHHHEGGGAPYADLVGATGHCVAAGNACLSHCVTLLGQGEKELAPCARAVRDVIAACGALGVLAAADSPHVKAFAQVVSDVCADCEAECRKHHKHAVCRDCEQACHDCKALCDKAAA